MEIKNIKVGSIVLFGRANGEKSPGKVLKVNEKTVKLELLVQRGDGKAKGAKAGSRWNVAPSFISAAPAKVVKEHSAPAAKESPAAKAPSKSAPAPVKATKAEPGVLVEGKIVPFRSPVTVKWGGETHEAWVVGPKENKLVEERPIPELPEGMTRVYFPEDGKWDDVPSADVKVSKKAPAKKAA